MRSSKVSKRQTDIVIVLAHIDAAYLQLQASLTTLAHNTRSQEQKANIGGSTTGLGPLAYRTLGQYQCSSQVRKRRR